MFLDQRGTLIEYLCDGSIDLIIIDSDADSCLVVKLLLIDFGFTTALADNLCYILDSFFELKGSDNLLTEYLVNEELGMMECSFGHFGSDSVQQIADVLVGLLNTGESDYFGESLGHLLVLKCALNDLGVKADSQE